MYNSYDIRQLFVKLLIYQGVILITFLFTYFFFLIIFFKNPQLIADQGQIVLCIAQWDSRVYLPSFFYIVYKYKNGEARIVRIQYFTNTQKVYNRHGISLRCLLPTCSWPIRREVDDTWPNLFPPYFWLTCHFFSIQVYMYDHKQEHSFILEFSFYLRVQCVLNYMVNFELFIL